MTKEQISVKNVPPDLLAKAKKLAKASDRSLSLVVRDLLREWVAEQEQKLPPPKK
jgi:hypothetical protein